MFARHYWIKPRLFFNIHLYLFIPYLVAPRLSCGTRDLWSSLGHAGSLVVTWELLVAAHGTWFPDQGADLGPAHWDPGVLASGPLGKVSQESAFSRADLGLLYLPLTPGSLWLFPSAHLPQNRAGFPMPLRFAHSESSLWCAPSAHTYQKPF